MGRRKTINCRALNKATSNKHYDICCGIECELDGAINAVNAMLTQGKLQESYVSAVHKQAGDAAIPLLRKAKESLNELFKLIERDSQHTLGFA